MEKAGEGQEEGIRLFARLHHGIQEAIEAEEYVLAMKLLEQCQDAALKLGNEMEAIEGKDCEIIPILDDYCELAYEINEQIWHGEYVNPGKVFRYLNKSLELIEGSIGPGKEP